MPEKEAGFTAEHERIRELQQRWEQALRGIAEKVLSNLGIEHRSEVPIAEIPHMLESATRSRLLAKRETADFIVVSSTPGTGKSAIGKILERNGIPRLPRATTRAKRPEEVEGRDYFFMTREEFEAKKTTGAFVYSKETYDDGRGIVKEKMDAFLQAKQKFYAEGDALAFATIRQNPEYADMEYQSIFLLSPSFEETTRRMEKSINERVARGGERMDDEELYQRLEKVIYYLEKSGDNVIDGTYDGYLVNDDLARVEQNLKETLGI